MVNMPTEYTDKAQETRSGYCAIVGRSNVGKSTLLNKLIGARVSPTSCKPQTTRQSIRGILTELGAQTVFIDTPGLHLKETHRLNTAMNKAAIASLDAADVILLVVEDGRWRPEEARILTLTAGANKPCLLCVNKIDRLRDRRDLLPVLAQLYAKFPFAALVPVSAVKGENLAALKSEIRKRLPCSQGFIFPEEQLSDREVRFIAAEMIREQLTRSLKDELPYAVYVEVANFEEHAGQVFIAATVWVARESHKAIVIGRSGSMLKCIGGRARASIGRFLNRQCHLKLWVNVKANWQDDPRIVGKLTA